MHNIKLKYIESEKNVVADDLSRVIYNAENCEFDQLVKNLYQKAMKHVNDDEWFWKIEKEKYRNMLKKLSNEDRKKRIKKYDDKIISKMYHTTSNYEREQSSTCSVECTTSSYEKEQSSTYFADWTIFKKNISSFEFDSQEIAKHTFRNLLTTVTINDESEIVESNYINDEWYSNIYKYYAWNQASEVNKVTMTTFKRKINIYRYDETSKRLLHKYKDEYCDCLQKNEIASFLQKIHDEADHFSINIVFIRIKNKIYWFYMITDVKIYVQECMKYALWAFAMRTISLKSIQTYQSYDLFDIDFIDWSKFSKYEYKHICNMMNYFFERLYSYSIYNIKIENAKQTFEYHKISEHLMSIAIYWNVDSTFKSMKMIEAFKNLNIVSIQASSQSHKSMRMIERINRILRVAMNKMKKEDENFVDTLRRAIFACNEKHIEHLSYLFDEIIFEIESRTFATISLIQATIRDEKIVLSTFEKMTSLIWNHMTRREKLRKNVVERTEKAKRKMKERYDVDVKQ